MEAIAVVTTPETTVAGSPALMVSNVSGFHSTPMFFLMRSMTSVAEMGGLAVSALVRANGAAMAETVRAPNSLLDRGVVLRQAVVGRRSLNVAINGRVYSRCGERDRSAGPALVMGRIRIEVSRQRRMELTNARSRH